MHPWHHALNSVKKWGGSTDDYLAIHDWFDQSKAHFADIRHRALRHHAQGIFWAEEVFGKTIVNSAGKTVPVRFIGEQHVREDLGWIPSLSDWLRLLPRMPWMRPPVTDTPEEEPKPSTKKARTKRAKSVRVRPSAKAKP